MCTIKQIDGKKVKLFIPKTAKKVAYFCHGVHKGDTNSISGVTLGYLAPHQTTTNVAPDGIGISPKYGPEKPNDKNTWYSYTLTNVSVFGFTDDNWKELATQYQTAIALVDQPTSTEDMVTALKDEGFKDIVAVHCREVNGADNKAWNPLTDEELKTVKMKLSIARNDLNNGKWFDDNWKPVNSNTQLKKGTEISNNEGYWIITDIAQDKDQTVSLVQKH